MYCVRIILFSICIRVFYVTSGLLDISYRLLLKIQLHLLFFIGECNNITRTNYSFTICNRNIILYLIFFKGIIQNDSIWWRSELNDINVNVNVYCCLAFVTQSSLCFFTVRRNPKFSDNTRGLLSTSKVHYIREVRPWINKTDIS